VKKILIIVFIFMVAGMASAGKKTDDNKYIQLGSLIDLQADMASVCRTHISVYSDMNSKECRMVYTLRDKIEPYILWYSKLARNKAKALALHKSHGALSFPDQLDKDLAYMGAFVSTRK